DVLANTSWDATAAAMERLLGEALAARRAGAPAQVVRRDGAADSPPGGWHVRAADAGPGKPAPPVVVVGAGPTGLSAAYHLGEDALLLEQNDRVGGWCRSVEVNGFTFDFAGHIMFSN